MYHRLTLFFLALIFSTAASSQIILDNTTNVRADSMVFSGILSQSTVEYDKEGVRGSFDVERTILGADILYGITNNVTMMGQIGYVLDGEYEHCDGSGYLVGGGARFNILRQEKFELDGYGMINISKERYKCERYQGDLLIRDIHVGPVGSFNFTKNFKVFVNMDLALSSDGEAKELSGKVDFDRDDLISIKSGVRYIKDDLVFRAETTLFSDFMITIAMGKML